MKHEPCEHCGGEVGPARPGSGIGGLCCYRCCSHWPEMRHIVPEAKQEACGAFYGGRCSFCDKRRSRERMMD